jgi:hypothetical protein
MVGPYISQTGKQAPKACLGMRSDENSLQDKAGNRSTIIRVFWDQDIYNTRLLSSVAIGPGSGRMIRPPRMICTNMFHGTRILNFCGFSSTANAHLQLFACK